MTRRVERPLQVHCDHAVPVGLIEVEDHSITQDPGNVHEDVETTELAHRGFDEVAAGFVVGDIGRIGDRLAAVIFDLGRDLRGGSGVVATAVHVDSRVGDHDVRTLERERPSNCGPDPPPSTRDHGNPPVEPLHVRHSDVLLHRWCSVPVAVSGRRTR